MAKQRGLGRGLGALIKEVQDEPASTPDEPAEAPAESGADSGLVAINLPVSSIVENPWQPRKRFDETPLEDLVNSVRVHGILQPLIVRPTEGGHQLIAGERRFRAAREAGLKEVPVIVRELSDREALELAMIENLQREDLNPIEEAEGYQALIQEFDLTQGEVAEQVGKGRTTVVNALRLLDLNKHCRKLVQAGQISAGHAKALLALDSKKDQEALADQIVREGLSVRATERLAAAGSSATKKKPRTEKPDIPAAHLKQVTERLQQHLGTGTRIIPSRTLANGKKARGKVEIDIYSAEDLDRIIGLLGLNEEL